jgi:hypothetical protein
MNRNCVTNLSKLISISVYLTSNGISEGMVLDRETIKDIKCEIHAWIEGKLTQEITRMINPLYLITYPDHGQMFILIENEKDATINKLVKSIVSNKERQFKIKIIEFPEAKERSSNNIVLLQNNYPFNIVGSRQFIPIRFVTKDEQALLKSSSAFGYPFTKISLANENVLNTIFKCTDVAIPEYISFITGNSVTGPNYTFKRVSK